MEREACMYRWVAPLVMFTRGSGWYVEVATHTKESVIL